MHTDLLASTQPSLAIVALLLLGSPELLNPVTFSQASLPDPAWLPRTLALTPAEEIERLAA
ncbi:hypothetical protein [Hymenobacter fodinae]|uniref:Uncharacterized protein n=1 Tax=Hymenobacter fodinae TaxID=2510796 RepID=A0A4Z0NYB8_9BACT|nr:hypothetical protein [Hymenobacter fodinae]TGE03341.1 hypothetical protein EU556_25840 [Hymenobacter fodinae]